MTLVAVAIAGAIPAISHAADYEAAELQFRSGEYDEAAEIAGEAVERGIWNERWALLLIRAQMARGRYAEALASYQAAIQRYSSSFRLRLLGVEVLRANDLNDEARLEWADIGRQLRRSTSRYASRDKLIAMGRYFADRGEDARQVLQLFYDRVRDADPEFLEAYIATAELAIEKGDFKIAAETLEQAEAVDGSDPRVFHLQAVAWAPTDSERATESLRRALSLNPRHVDSLLFQVDNAIDRERYDEAESTISEILEINLHQPQAWAYLAVLAHLRGDYELEGLMRAAALSTWSANPEVDHLIGRKLSDKYRFDEGAAYQRQALLLDPKHSGAKFQLAQDMLRLGKDEIGWELAERVAEEDAYNVVAHNLMTLRDRVQEFRTLQSGDVRVRMEAREAEIYGEAALALLAEAREVLFEKYDVEPDQPIVVELFPEQKDFAIRTFGLPGGAGFLGVCFGHVITANSPASQGERPANWQSVLWHEMCHVATLGKTNNRMPRWLSEGISVYEERQRDPAWGEQMTPRYRHMIMEELTPVSQLSGAFLNPPSPVHLQFAYYESSLVVEFLIERHGLDTLLAILTSLGDGMGIDDALVRNAGSLAKIDAEFADYARGRAEAFGSELDWSREAFPEEASGEQLREWCKSHPDNYWALRALAQSDIEAGRLPEAAETLEKLREYGVTSGERGGVLEQLAGIYQELGELDREREVLRAWAGRASDALPGLLRLIELAREEEAWDEMIEDAGRVLAIQPLLPIGHLRLSEAAEQLERPQQVVEALRPLSALDPIDPAGLHYRRAKALAELERHEQAKRQVLMALEDAPRYRDALRLLVRLHEQTETETESESETDAATEDETATEESP